MSRWKEFLPSSFQFAMMEEDIRIGSKWFDGLLNISVSRFLFYDLYYKANFTNFFEFMLELCQSLNIMAGIFDTSSMTSKEMEALPYPVIGAKFKKKERGRYQTESELRIFNGPDEVSRVAPLLIFAAEVEQVNYNSLLLKATRGLLLRSFASAKLFLALGLIVYFLLFSLEGSVAIYILLVVLVLAFGFYFTNSIRKVETNAASSKNLAAKICASENQEDISDCRKLAAKTTNFFGLFEWSEMGILYFTSAIYAVAIGLIIDRLELVIGLILLFGLMGILFSFFSVYHQIRQKLFCKVCAVTIGLPYPLIGLFFFIDTTAVPTIAPRAILLVLLLAGVSLAIATLDEVMSKQLMMVKHEYTLARRNLFRLIENQEVFHALNVPITNEALLKQAYQVALPFHSHPENHTIINHRMILIVNPECGYCLEVLQEVVATRLFDVAKVLVVIELTNTGANTPNHQVVRFLVTALRKEKNDAFVQLFKQWRENRNLDEFKILATRLVGDLSDQDQQQSNAIMGEQQQLIENLGISSTPTLIWNGIKMHHLYRYNYFHFLLK